MTKVNYKTIELGTCLQFQRLSSWPSWQGACRQAGGCGTGAQLRTHTWFTSTRQTANREWCRLWKTHLLVTHHQGHTLLFLPKPSHQLRPRIRIYEPMDAMLIQTSTYTLIVFGIRGESLGASSKMTWQHRTDWHLSESVGCHHFFSLNPCTFSKCCYYHFKEEKNGPTLRLIGNSEYSFQVFWGKFLESLHSFPYVVCRVFTNIITLTLKL